MITQFEKVCKVDDLDEGAARVYRVGDISVLVAKIDGQIYAIDNICSHDGGDLGEGTVVECQVECPRHGARFDIRTGEVTRMPAVEDVDTYEIKIENGEVYVAVES
jgi:3-phenylpropionate/trans-cinnamate dioxygenase ferredoxin subunit